MAGDPVEPVSGGGLSTVDSIRPSVHGRDDSCIPARCRLREWS